MNATANYFIKFLVADALYLPFIVQSGKVKLEMQCQLVNGIQGCCVRVGTNVPPSLNRSGWPCEEFFFFHCVLSRDSSINAHYCNCIVIASSIGFVAADQAQPRDAKKLLLRHRGGLSHSNESKRKTHQS